MIILRDVNRVVEVDELMCSDLQIDDRHENGQARDDSERTEVAAGSLRGLRSGLVNLFCLESPSLRQRR